MRIDIPMPKAGLTMVEGTISEWKVSEGALIQKGDAIMEYENEKNTIEYESVHGGYLHILEAAGASAGTEEVSAAKAPPVRASYSSLVSVTQAMGLPTSTVSPADSRIWR